MDPWANVDLYCERTDWGFWSEPLNALTNFAYLLAAALIVARVRRGQARLPWDAGALATLATLVGAGSFLFHTFATVWGRWLDLGFIALFIYFLLARFLARVGGLGWKGILAGLLAYWIFERVVLAALSPGTLGGSIVYLPALATLAGLALFARQRGSPSASGLGAAAGVLVVALIFRTIDLPACTAWPAGTHFVWHCLSAWTLYLAATSLFATRKASGSGLNGPGPDGPGKTTQGFGNVPKPSPGRSSEPSAGHRRSAAASVAGFRVAGLSTRRARGDSTMERSRSSAGTLYSAHSWRFTSSIMSVAWPLPFSWSDRRTDPFVPYECRRAPDARVSRIVKARRFSRPRGSDPAG